MLGLIGTSSPLHHHHHRHPHHHSPSSQRSSRPSTLPLQPLLPPPPPPSLPLVPARSTSPPLPRGDCRFILLLPDVSGQRCACQGYRRNDGVPGSSCECGHQACYHAPDAHDEGVVSRREYGALLDRLAALEAECRGHRTDAVRDRVKSLEAAVDRAESRTTEDIRAVCRALQGLHASMTRLQLVASDRFVAYDDRIEGLVDRTAAVDDDLRSVRARVVAIDDLTMQLEDHVAELSGVEEPTPSSSRPKPARVCGHDEEEDVGKEGRSWSTRVTVLPSSIVVDGPVDVAKVERRCRSRGLSREVTFEADSSEAIVRAVEACFDIVIAGRRWVPLRRRPPGSTTRLDLSVFEFVHAGSGPAGASHRHLSMEHTQPASGVDSGSGRVLYITVVDDALTWDVVRRMPVSGESGQNEDCWDTDESLGDEARPSAPERRVETGCSKSQDPWPGHQRPDERPPTNGEPWTLSMPTRKRRSQSTSSIFELPPWPKKRATTTDRESRIHVGPSRSEVAMISSNPDKHRTRGKALFVNTSSTRASRCPVGPTSPDLLSPTTRNCSRMQLPQPSSARPTARSFYRDLSSSSSSSAMAVV
ncbi:MAG: hypothetical protein M1815_002987 [Lichina confinis]|nr:MAG: hypothetical protein M1815_002987 [Lichina confinis]